MDWKPILDKSDFQHIVLTGAVSPFQGTATGSWSGQMTIGTTVTSLTGNLSATMDENGVITGTMTGDYSGKFAGQVAANGNLSGTGNFMVGATPYATAWIGTATVTSLGNLQEIDIKGT